MSNDVVQYLVTNNFAEINVSIFGVTVTKVKVYYLETLVVADHIIPCHILERVTRCYVHRREYYNALKF